MRVRIATIQLRMGMRRKKHPKPMMDQGRMCRIDLGPSNVDGFEGEDGDDADEEEKVSAVDDGSTRNVED
jgi:hypothetical protein